MNIILRKMPLDLMRARSLPSVYGFVSSGASSLQAGCTRSFVGGYIPRNEDTAFSKYYKNEKDKLSDVSVVGGDSDKEGFAPKARMNLGAFSSSSMLLVTLVAVKNFAPRLLKFNEAAIPFDKNESYGMPEIFNRKRQGEFDNMGFSR